MDRTTLIDAIQHAGGILPPFLSLDKFSELVGFSKPTVEFWVRTGKLPSKKIGKRRVIDYLSLLSGGSFK